MAGEKLVKKALDFLKAHPEFKPYKGGSFSLERQGVYNPKYFDLKKDDLVDEAGNVIASKDVAIPREGFSYDLPAQADPNKIFRGMSAEEFANFQKNKYIQSLGTHNIGEGQKGLTYFSVNPDEARSYAHSFAPSDFKPDPSRPAYVVAAKRPPDESIARVPGTGESEVGVMGQIPRENVTNVYRGNVVDYIEGINEPSAKISPSSSVHWEEINDYARGGSVDQALHLLQDQYPTQYMPNVGRQVMQAGGTTGEAMTLEDILALIRSGGAEPKEFDPRIPQLDANRAFQPPGSKFSNQALPILPTRVIPSEPRPADNIPLPPSRPAEFTSASQTNNQEPSIPMPPRRPAEFGRAPSADDTVSRALWAAYNESESPADFLRADAAMREGRAGGGKSVSKALKAVFDPAEIVKMLRKQRPEQMRLAKDAGFDTKNIWLHGTQTSPSEINSNLYISKDPSIADVYARKGEENLPHGSVPEGAAIMPVFVKKDAAIPGRPGMGYYRVENPQDVRSIWADFDPAQKESGNINYAGGGKTVSKALKAVSELFDSPGMAQWREGSMIPASRVEDRYFTGTSKDKDFANFNVGRHGAWFTKDPTEASAYALDNDSRNLRYNPDTRRYDEVNTADRVIPAFLRSENPFTGPLPDMARAENYKKAQSDWFDQLRAQGHDAWMPETDPNLAVILRDPSNIKSAISNTGEFDRTSSRVDRAEGGHVLSDDYPTSYMPNVGRQVMAGGGEAEDDYQSPRSRVRAALDLVQSQMGPQVADGEGFQRALQNYRNFPQQQGEATARPLQLDARDVLGGAIAGDPQRGDSSYLNKMRRRSADAIFGSTGMPGSGTLGFGIADAPLVTGLPLMASDIAGSAGRGDYAEAALGAALPAAFYARQPIGKALGVARDALGRVPAPVAAGATAAAVMSPDEAEASPASAIAKRVMRGTPELRASTRFPTGAKATEDPIKQQLTIGPAEMKASPGFEHNMGLLANYPGFAHLKGRSPEDQLSAYVDQARGNLNFLYEKAPEIMRQRSPLWYEGANNFSDALADRYGIPRQSSSAALAALSPQMDWFKNASLAERVGDVIFSPTASSRMTPEMEAFQKASTALTSDANQRVFNNIQGKRFSELTDPLDQALWIRLYDEAHNPRNYRSLSPEGNLGDYIKSGSGEPAKIGWGSLNEIAKAVRAYTSGGDMNVISPMLGTKHKVRSFYNNIELPNDRRFGDVTADTHAVAASQLRPLSGNTPAVAHNLASGLAKSKQPAGYQSEKSSAITGVQGTYGANAEATRLAAADQGLLPREMQSTTWEPVRELFPAKWKTPKNVEAVDDIWRKKDAGDITVEQARRAILDLAGGFSQPSWAERGFTAVDPRKASTYR